MQNLKYILENLRSNQKISMGRGFYIPEAWNCFNYQKGEAIRDRPGELLVDPYDFYATSLESLLQVGKGMDRAEKAGRGENLQTELYKSVIYSMLPRTFTAWNHGQGEEVEAGTFLKTLALLPYLKNLGVDMVYLLPPFEVSKKYKKGEVGSPYAIKNLHRLDPALHDNLLGERSLELLEIEFKAFIEACHLLEIKVLVDFVFRTVSRDNDLLVDHPDWFYWIHLEAKEDFAPPVLEKAKKLSTLHDKTLMLLYTSEGIGEYLNKFTHSPKEIDADRWEKVVAEQKESGENILDLIEREFKVTTVPGFSDVLNDPQPPWADVTYLRFYHDIHAKARRYVPKEQPPYLLQDVACLNRYQGDEPISQLWQYIAGVIPYYQKKFGIDGARIDMGHALPPALNKAIISRIKQEKPDFILWSEEFHAKNSRAAQEDGFHFITGNLWHIYKDLERPRFCRRLFSALFASVLPVTGALETADTPRAALVYRDRRKLELLVALNCFIPNSIPLINNGLELMETQPMNLGLDNTEEGRFVLDPEDPMYGKLAFFDQYRLPWLSKDRVWMGKLLKTTLTLRESFQELIRREFLVRESGAVKEKSIVFLHYHHPFSQDSSSGQGRDLFFLANRDFTGRVRINLCNLVKKEYRINLDRLRLVYADGEVTDRKWQIDSTLLLSAGAVLILENGCRTSASNSANTSASASARVSARTR